MPFLYGRQRINFGKPLESDLPRYQFDRTLRSAIDLSSTSYSYQETQNGNIYQWDNIAPEVALVILQDAKKHDIDIQKEVLNIIGSPQKYNDSLLQKVLDSLNNNPNYLLFTQKLALHITGKQCTALTLEQLKSAGIKTIEHFDEVFKKFLFEQKILTKTFPNFSKIKDSDDYYQFIVYLANNPLFEKFLKSFTESLANEFNKSREQSNQVKVPNSMDERSLLDFFQSIGHDLILKAPSDPLKKNVLYIEIINNTLQYTVIDPSGKSITDVIKPGMLGFTWNEVMTEADLKNHLPNILQITYKRGHTGVIALNNTASLRDKGASYLVSDENHDLFLSNLPAVDLVTDEGNKYTLYQWLAQGNLPQLKDHIVEGACQRYYQELALFVTELTLASGQNKEWQKEIHDVHVLMKEITDIIASLEDSPEVKNKELDSKIGDLIEHLKNLKDLSFRTPLVKSGEIYPSSQGNFEAFVKKILFLSTSDKVVRYIPDSKDKNKTWKLDLIKLINNLMIDKPFVEVQTEINKNDRSNLTDEQSVNIPPAIILREQLKAIITTRLKSNVHHYYTSRSYENDKLSMRQAPVTFRGGNLTDSLKETKPFAKKMTRMGEYAADSHLLVGQENNIRKHEVRSGTAAALLAGTGVDGTRSVTDKFDVALQCGGMKDIKIMYIMRGKEAFSPQSFSDPLGKNKFSEIAYTHVNPNDYVMTILYDKNNVILDVIPGNLSGEIQGLSEIARDVIDAGIQFYNIKHNADLEYKPEIKLPNAMEQRQTHANHSHKAKSLFDIVESHKTGSGRNTKEEYSESFLSSTRITRCYLRGNKVLVMDKLQPRLDLVTPPSSKLELPDLPFTLQPGRLDEIRKQARTHFNMRHVLTLNGFVNWGRQERKLQETYNRILQPGFMEGDIEAQLMHAQIAQESWLTDVLVPRIQTALMLHIAARLITDYRVDVEEVNRIAQQLFLDFTSKGEYYVHLMELWFEISLELNVLDKTGVYKSCLDKAEERMMKLYPTLKTDTHEYKKKFKSCLEIEKNKVRKQRLNHSVSEFLDKHLDNFTQKIGLEKKTFYPLGSNKDLIFLGPAASGKSTIANQYVTKEARKDYVSLATDDYRGIYMPFTERFEEQETTQVFIRTQDSAFLISELVEERMKTQKIERPNVIVDGVTYKYSHRVLIEQNKNSVIVCACLDDIGEVVKRSYDRALKEDSGSADKGRHVNTSSLLEMHKTASLNLIIHCPANTTIVLYNTNIPRGHKPSLIGTIDTHGEKTLTISHDKGALMNLASFFNKARVNVAAMSDESLFFTKIKRPEFQIDSLCAVMNHGFKIILNGDNNKPCLTLEKNKNGKTVMKLLDSIQIKKKLQEHGTEKQLIQMLLLYGEHGSLKEVQKICLLHDKIDLIIDTLMDSKADLQKEQHQTNQTPFF